MLSAAVAGSVFASPNVSQIRHAINLVYGPSTGSSGVLIVVKNYTGDVLHFGLAAEQTRAALSEELGSKVRVLVVGDDVAVGKSQGSLVGRRYVIYYPLPRPGSVPCRNTYIDHTEVW